ncbi:PqqD family protein [Sphingomonas sp. So64.6b]|uniref:PqqD family peptide modification chaperone n=1 Tax=Sphingomonas sp. So64.6b TaxID=2997354 RepID=UPI0015FFAB68|nr:PqqD family peptide modification chaperone [Sphingomonas sp. So64.6b]QNA84367.1 PqqD family protein [Sphingomonas sp. So64.6b]
MIERRGDWLSARVGDEIMMMSAEKGNYLGVNEVGARIWELIETPNDIDAVCAALQREFVIEPDTCRTEVEAFLEQMEKHGAVAVTRP